MVRKPELKSALTNTETPQAEDFLLKTSAIDPGQSLRVVCP